MNAVILETVKAAILNLGIHKFISSVCHAHSKAHKPPKTGSPTVLMLESKF